MSDHPNSHNWHPEHPDRIDARKLLNTDPTARAVHDMVAHLYLKGTLTVAEMRILFTLGLEYAMTIDTRPVRIVHSTVGEDKL